MKAYDSQCPRNLLIELAQFAAAGALLALALTWAAF